MRKDTFLFFSLIQFPAGFFKRRASTFVPPGKPKVIRSRFDDMNTKMDFKVINVY